MRQEASARFPDPKTAARCWVDVFDSPAFRGERRRIFGPARIDAHTLGFGRANSVSVRVGAAAALRIGLAGGTDTMLHAGQAVDALDTARICWLEVGPEEIRPQERHPEAS